MNDEFDNKEKTLGDATKDAIDFFINEYNKNGLRGMYYEYILGSNKDNLLEYGADHYDEKINSILNETERNTKAIMNLVDAGLITEYKIDQKTLEDFSYVDYIYCKINEDMLPNEKHYIENKKIKGVKNNIMKVVHNVIFENSIQEKQINLNLNYENDEGIGLINFIIKNENKKYYLYANDQRLNEHLTKGESDILNKFKNNYDLIPKEKFTPKKTYNDSFNRHKARINAKLKKLDLEIISERKKKKTFYKITKK